MDQLTAKKPIAYCNWPKETAPEKGMVYGVQAQDIPVWLLCREDSMQFAFVKGRLHPGTSPKTAQLIIVCPLCGRNSGQQLRIPGHLKTFEWEALPEPMPVPISDCEEDAYQTVSLTVREKMSCPTCNRYFGITENTLHKA